MANKNYAKYIKALEPTGIKHPEYGKKMREPLKFGDKIFPGANVQVPLQMICEGDCGWGLGLKLENPPGNVIMDLPHTHDCDEIWLFFGTNPKDNKDLGGEIEFWMGEGDEAEKYTITEPSAVYVPAGVAHCPVYYKTVKRPIISIPILLGDNCKTSYINKIPATFKRSKSRP